MEARQPPLLARHGRSKPALFIFCLIFSLLAGCAHGKIPVVLEGTPAEPYEVIGVVETEVTWYSLQWLWYWWHYMPWYSSVHKVHEEKLVKKARKLGADAVINIEQLPHRSGARGEAIRFK